MFLNIISALDVKFSLLKSFRHMMSRLLTIQTMLIMLLVFINSTLQIPWSNDKWNKISWSFIWMQCNELWLSSYLTCSEKFQWKQYFISVKIRFDTLCVYICKENSAIFYVWPKNFASVQSSEICSY
jgi:hypothetical protein